jgi:lincosamide nucleotidyltransferase A/C/D/E
MTEPDVEFVLGELETAGIGFWVGGGWGIDALVGRQTRDHDDLDLSIAASDLERALALLERHGFDVVTYWLPVRVAVGDNAGLEIDLHPIVFEADGSAWLPGLDGDRFHYPADSFVEGQIAGRTVPCISAHLQLTFHLGYEPTDKDRADMASLIAAGLIAASDAAGLVPDDLTRAGRIARSRTQPG